MSDLSKKYPPRVDPPGVPLRMPERRERKKRRGLKRVNKERAAKVRESCFGPCARMARLLPCVVPSCGRQPPVHRIEAAHVRSRGAGGKDWGNCVGLCSLHHRQQGDLGIETFQKRHGLDLAAAASRIASAVQEHECVSWQKRGQCAVCLREVA